VSIGVLAVLCGCSDGPDAAAAETTTTLNLQSLIEESGPYRCTEQLSAVVATMMDTQNLQLAQDAWGYPSPATEFALNLYAVLTGVRLQEGFPVAVERLTEYSASACFDGDIANDVTRFIQGEPGFVSACLDGIIPSPGGPVCTTEVSTTVLSRSDAGGHPNQQTQPALGAAPLEPSSATHPSADEAFLSNLSDGAQAPWQVVATASEVGLDDLVSTMRANSELSACPFLWPLDQLVEWEQSGEGLPGFVTWGLTIYVQTPGGNDYGGVSVWIDGHAPFDTAFETGADLERYELANGDVLEVAYGEYNEARITLAGTDCVWSFGAGSAEGLDVLADSLVTLA
jgi:hypothetical protein